MDTNNEILDAIEILADKKIGENITKILTGICKSVNINNNTCVMDSNGVISTVQFYGSPPEVNELYRIFVPSNNMSRSFIVVPPKFTVNPNLLGNWYFGNPVNQRGKTEYSGSAGYWIDRWKRDAGIVCAVDGGMVTCTRLSAGNNAISQLLDGYAGLAGQTVTLSVLCAGTPGTSVTVGHNDGGSSVYETYTPCTGALQLIRSTFTVAAVPTQFASIARAQFSENFAEESVKFLAAKLELGPTQTLAHREGDKWVLNEVPDYGEQLRRCLRHDYIIGSNTDACPICTGTAYSSDSVIAVVDLPEVMRSNPAVVISGGIQIRFSATQNFTVSTVENYGFSGDKVQLYFSGLSGLTPGQSCDLYTQSGSKIEFNANL